MRFMLTVSAVLATALFSGLALAHGGSCDECRSRDKPNIRQQVMERFSSAAPKEQIPDRRFGRERPSIVNKADPREKVIDPHQSSRPMVGTAPSDKPLPTTPVAAKAGGQSKVKDMVNSHLAKKGRPVGGTADVDQTFGSVPVAQTSGIKLKVLQIQKPVNSRLQVSPKIPCTQGGQCINGSSNDPTPKIEQTEDRPAPKFLEKFGEVKDAVNKRQLSQTQVQAPMKSVRKGDLRTDQTVDRSVTKPAESRPGRASKTRPDER
jgi:hypothetical protein